MQYQITCVLDFLVQLDDDYLIYDKTKLVSTKLFYSDLKEITSLIENEMELEVTDYLPIHDLSCYNKFPNINMAWTEWLIYSLINKYGKNFKVTASTKVFKFAVPIILRNDFDVENVVINSYELDGIREESALSNYEVDNLDDLDLLLEDIIEEEL